MTVCAKRCAAPPRYLADDFKMWKGGAKNKVQTDAKRCRALMGVDPGEHRTRPAGCTLEHAQIFLWRLCLASSLYVGFGLEPGIALAQDGQSTAGEALSSPSDPRFTLSADYRLRVESVSNPFFALRETADSTSFNHRFLIHGNVKFDGGARLFGQLGYYLEDGREPTARSFDEGDPDIQQLFFDWSEPSVSPLSVRLGRQEMPFGSGRLFALRDGANVRRSFDAVKLGFKGETISLQTFYGRPVSVKDDAFDDNSSTAEQVWGAYGTLPAVSNALDIYYFGRAKDNVSWTAGTEDETRHTLGVRWRGAAASFDYDVEAAYQFGSFGDAAIASWGIASEFGFKVEDAHGAPRFAVRVNAASGDDDPTDGRVETFDALYPNLSYFTEAAVYAPANAIDIRPYIQIHPAKEVTVAFGADAIFRIHAEDAVFGAGYVPLVAGGVSGSGLSTVLLDMSINWQINPSVSLKSAYVRGFAGDVVRDAEGENFDFAVVQLAVSF